MIVANVYFLKSLATPSENLIRKHSEEKVVAKGMDKNTLWKRLTSNLAADLLPLTHPEIPLVRSYLKYDKFGSYRGKFVGDDTNSWDFRTFTACPNNLVLEVEAWAKDFTPTLGKIEMSMKVEGDSPSESTLTWKISYPTELNDKVVKGLENKRSQVISNLVQMAARL